MPGDLGFMCLEIICLACSGELDRCSLWWHTRRLLCLNLLTTSPSHVPLCHMPCPPSCHTHLPILSDPTQCLTPSRHLIDIFGMVKQNVVHFRSVELAALEGFLEELPALGISHHFQHPRQLLTAETRLLACVCLWHDVCVVVDLPSDSLQLWKTFWTCPQPLSSASLCGTWRDSRPYSVRFICDVCNTVH